LKTNFKRDPPWQLPGGIMFQELDFRLPSRPTDICMDNLIVFARWRAYVPICFWPDTSLPRKALRSVHPCLQGSRSWPTHIHRLTVNSQMQLYSRRISPVCRNIWTYGLHLWSVYCRLTSISLSSAWWHGSCPSR